MGSLSFSLQLSLSPPPKPNKPSSSTTQLICSKPISWPHKFSSNTVRTGHNRKPRHKQETVRVFFGGKSSVGETNQEGPPQQFLDENGVVDDMDGYLNYLSLEYDSVWDTKPSWCQPWTITLTGVAVIAGCWLIVQSTVVTSIVLVLICTWWYIFLYSYPKAYSEMIAERRKKVSTGVEDTFGSRRQ